MKEAEFLESLYTKGKVTVDAGELRALLQERNLIRGEMEMYEVEIGTLKSVIQSKNRIIDELRAKELATIMHINLEV